jgi:predicted DNA-binding transcriptional regulator AlpA
VCSVTGIAGPSVYLTAADLCERYHCSRMTDANFPKPTKFGGSKTATRRWAIAAIEAWEAERAAS